MKFKVIDNNSEIECNIVLTFKDDSNDINYIVYTDGTLDDNNELEVYSSRYSLKDDNYILEPIEYESEWNLIDNMLESKYKEFGE